MHPTCRLNRLIPTVTGECSTTWATAHHHREFLTVLNLWEDVSTFSNIVSIFININLLHRKSCDNYGTVDTFFSKCGVSEYMREYGMTLRDLCGLTFCRSHLEGMKLRLCSGRLVTGCFITSCVKKSIHGCRRGNKCTTTQSSHGYRTGKVNPIYQQL